ncbi:MAG: DUF362 domain-containing protein, partial [Planctomycetes bacterium]|nr:DUF362 domain-containing protein [Planctomycetota bacterium]
PPPPPPPPPPGATPTDTYLAVARGESPTAMVRAAIEALGGIERFVKRGNDVVIKPNICSAYHSYEYAATTNPEVVAALVQLCLGAGAKRVRVMDNAFAGTAAVAYKRSGITEAVQQAGGEMELMTRMKFRETEIPEGRDIKKWRVYGDVLDTDVLINVPIAKHHSLTKLTLGIKNLMGVMGGRRGTIHREIDSYLTDMLRIIPPHLTVIDAYRVLTAHGPTGGNLADVKMAKKIIAGFDPVAVDAYAATLPEFGLEPADINYIYTAAEEKLGEMDLSKMNIIKKTI